MSAPPPPSPTLSRPFNRQPTQQGCVTGEGCTAAPGTAFTYDSEQYIEHISYLIGKTAKIPAVEWVTKMMTKKLGLPDFYALDEMEPVKMHTGLPTSLCWRRVPVGEAAPVQPRLLPPPPRSLGGTVLVYADPRFIC